MFKKWLIRLTNSRIMSLTFAVILLLVIWQVINFWQVTRWQQTLLAKLTVTEPQKINKTKAEDLAEARPPVNNNKVKPLSLVQIDLPTLPVVSTPISTLSLTSELKQGKQEKKYPNQKKEHSNPPQPVKHNKQIKSVAAMYETLISNNAIDIEIAWPNDTADRQNTFSFLYQCIGMKFGVLNWQNENGQQTNKQKVILAKNPYISVTEQNNGQVSDWLRIAQGQLATQERRWLKQYSLSGTAVRLFPKKLDWQLAHLLTQQLNTIPLTSFRARYKYINNSLMLTNIQLNGLLLSNNWTLITSKCSI